jgi:predicted transcriptional regulator
MPAACQYTAGMRKGDTVTITVRLPAAIDQKVREVAHSEHSSVNRTVVVAVERYIRAWEARQQRAAADAR